MYYIAMPSTANLKQRAYRHIRAQIMDGRLPAGQRISELRLAKDIGISRTPVREAVHLLSSEGFLEMVPGFGAFVPLPDKDELRGLFGLREALECYAIQEAVARITPQQIDALRDCCRRHFASIRQFKESGRADFDEETEVAAGSADVSFHRTLWQIADNPWLLKVVSDLRLMSRLMSRRIDVSRENLLPPLVFAYKCHRRVLAALRRKDAVAATHWMRVHLREALARFLKQIETPPAGEETTYASLRRAISRLEHFDTRSPSLPSD
jgi:DNA-binding GntR family transcriptional regulator